MRYVVAQHEAVDVLGSLVVPERSGKPVGEHPESGGFLVGQFPQAGDVAFGFDHQVPEVHVGQFGGKYVTGVRQPVVVDDPTRHTRPTGVFVADEAVLVRQSLTSNSVRPVEGIRRSFCHLETRVQPAQSAMAAPALQPTVFAQIWFSARSNPPRLSASSIHPTAGTSVRILE